MKTALAGGSIYATGRLYDPGYLLFENDTILEVGELNQLPDNHNLNIVDISGRIAAPGFVDLLCHGGGGYDFFDGVVNFPVIEEHFRKSGTTTLLASFIATPKQKLLKGIRDAAAYIRANPDSIIQGIHLEGPFMNPVMKGGMNDAYFRTPSVDEFDELLEAADGKLRVMTISPELNNADKIIKRALAAGVVISLGHTESSFAVAEQAFAFGASMVTHCCNAMPPLHHRSPGFLNAALLNDDVSLSVIADGIHVYPEMLSLLYKTAGAERLCLITDSIKGSGVDGSAFTYADQPFYIKDGLSYLEDGTLAGSTLTMQRGVEVLHREAGIPLQEVFQIAASNPAKLIGLEQAGALKAGMRADITVLNKGTFTAEMVISKGRV